MTPENFCYWLQGYMEITDDYRLNAHQASIVKDHLKLVFEKKTPKYRLTTDAHEQFREATGEEINLVDFKNFDPNKLIGPNDAHPSC